MGNSSCCGLKSVEVHPTMDLSGENQEASSRPREAFVKDGYHSSQKKVQEGQSSKRQDIKIESRSTMHASAVLLSDFSPVEVSPSGRQSRSPKRDHDLSLPGPYKGAIERCTKSNPQLQSIRLKRPIPILSKEQQKAKLVRNNLRNVF